MPKTIEEIARDTGFSVTTIRLIANGRAAKYRISKSTQQIVEDHIRRYGYVVNHTARSLKLQRTDTIGLVVPAISNAFFARLMGELERLCRSRGLVLLTASTYEDPAQEELAVHSLLARGVDGMIIAPCRQPDYGRFIGRKSRVAIVIIDRAYASSRYASIASDNFSRLPESDPGNIDRGRAPHSVPLRKSQVTEHRRPHPRLLDRMLGSRRVGVAGPRL